MKRTRIVAFFAAAALGGVFPLTVPAQQGGGHNNNNSLDTACQSNSPVITVQIAKTGPTWNATSGTWVYGITYSSTFNCYDGNNNNCAVTSNVGATIIVDGEPGSTTTSGNGTSRVAPCGSTGNVTNWTYTFPRSGSTLTAGDQYDITAYVTSMTINIVSSTTTITVPPNGP